METENEYSHISTVAGIARCLDDLGQQDGAYLLLDRDDATPQPVLLVKAEEGESLVVDISAVREILYELRFGASFRLVGQQAGKLERSQPLTIDQHWEEEGGGVYVSCPYPEFFEVLVRRNSFRAELRKGMDCDVLVSGDDRFGVWDGKLKNLSMVGALVELPLGAASMLADECDVFSLELSFPNGTRFDIGGKLCHQSSDVDQRKVSAGFEFEELSIAQDRQLWYFVREIEREGARYTASEDKELSASPLFVRSPNAQATEPRQKYDDLATPAARDLSFIAEFLDSQVLALRGGENIDSVQLSRHAERLLGMLEDAREELLFATACLYQESVVVRHCLSVAVRLVDIAGNSMPRELCKSMIAAAMVHDLGKVMLPNSLLQSPQLGEDEKLYFYSHVPKLYERLADCGWLAGEVSDPVLLQINERLDGSGYPDGIKGEELHQLARLAAVVDVVDAMGRTRPGRPAHTVDTIYTYLQSIPMHFDPRWVKNYIRYFGAYPIGTLLQYRDGTRGWVRRLDDERLPRQIQVALKEGPPKSSTLGVLVEGEELQALGNPEVVVPAE